MHRLLEQQLQKHFGASATFPDQWRKFIDDIDAVYQESVGTATTHSGSLVAVDTERRVQETAEALRLTEQRLRTIVENLPLVLFTMDMDGNYTLSEGEGLRAMGMEPGELVGKNALEFYKDNETLVNEFRRALQGESFTGISQIDDFTMECTFTPLKNEQDEMVGVIGLANNVTERFKAEQDIQIAYEQSLENVKAASEISQQIANAKDIVELYQNAVDAIHEKLDLYNTQIFRFNPANDSLVLVAGYGEEGARLLTAGYKIEMGESVVGRAAKDRQSVLLENVNQDPEWVANPYFPDTYSEIAAPIVIGDELLGVINAHCSTGVSVTSDTQIILDVLAGQLAVAMESIRLRTEMEERLRELNRLQQMTAQEGWREFQQGRRGRDTGYLYDPAQDSPTNLANEASDGNGYVEVGTGSPKDSIIKKLQVRGEVIGGLGVREEQDKPLDEEEQALLDSVTLQVAEALERARLFEQSQRSAAELAVLNEMGNSFTEDLDEASIIENTHLYASRLIKSPGFMIALYNREENQISFPLVVQSDGRVWPDHPDSKHYQPRPANTGIVGHIIQNRQPILIDDKAEERLRGLGIEYTHHGGDTQSWLGVPMALGERVLGVIVVQSEDTPNLFNEHDLELLSAIASQSAIAIDNARLLQLEQARAEQERLVRTITDKVRRGGDRQTILKIALEELGKVLGADESIVQLGTREQLLSNNATQSAPQPRAPRDSTASLNPEDLLS
ncbi:MAG: GAF domain-containing protein [Chloroflexi bacterium]|nr:MAG: GAF domain-containing protein [Chloroflexota bacterium]MBL1194094.1 GAF domain-containing protein [Chloroflexota bacterium]NOH11388.1 GAF domain-containing protein [Chloroflexota bacterium]